MRLMWKMHVGWQLRHILMVEWVKSSRQVIYMGIARNIIIVGY